MNRNIEEPLITVIILTYNRGLHIEKAIYNVLNQTYVNTEVLIIDDNSTDNTENVINQIQDNRIKYKKLDKHLGASGAWNVGIECARGEYIAFQTGDALWYPEKLQLEMEKLLKEDCGMVFCKFKTIGGQESIIPVEDTFDLSICEHGMADFLIEENRIGTSTVLLKKALLNQYGGFDEKMKTLEDWELAIRISMNTKVGFVNQILMDAYVPEDGVNRNLGVARLEAFVIVIERYWGQFTEKRLFGAITRNIINYIELLFGEERHKYIKRIIKTLSREHIVLSVIIPVFNVENYLAQCLESVLKQPMTNFEVICVNDGSTDHSLEILREYENRDSRVKVIDKLNSGYGDSVNIGLQVAAGEYVSIVESDDSVCEHALTDLCIVALAFGADVVKGNYNLCQTASGLKETYENISHLPDFQILSSKDRNGLFFVAPSIWSGIYKRSFLDKNELRFLNTPGASYQDTSFAFKVWACAEKIALIHKPIIDYRQDNENSSSNEIKKIFNICVECAELEHFIQIREREDLYPVFAKVKYISYGWNANRLTPENKVKFWLCVQPEFRKLKDEGYLLKKYWAEEEWDFVQNVIDNITGICSSILSGQLTYSFKMVQILRSVAPIYIYGAGVWGRQFKRELEFFGIHLTAFVVSDDKYDPNMKCDSKVIPLSKSDPDSLIIIGVSDRLKDEVIKVLKENNRYNYIEYPYVIRSEERAVKDAIQKQISKGILYWYPFKSGRKVLLIEENDAIKELLNSFSLEVCMVSIQESEKEEFISNNLAGFDYIVAIEVLERCHKPEKILKNWNRIIKPEGILLLGMDNRLGLKYFCGDQDAFTNGIFDGIENYSGFDIRSLMENRGRSYAKFEIKKLLEDAGFTSQHFFSVLPDLKSAQLIYEESTVPEEDLSIRYLPQYHTASTVFACEEKIYESIILNGMFHQMANSYLIECGAQKNDIKKITLSMERGMDATVTVVHKDEVEKIPVSISAENKVISLLKNEQDLRTHGIKMVEGKIRNHRYIMPFVEAPLGNVYLQQLLVNDMDKFIEKMDVFRELIMQSSSHVEENDMGIILEKGYFDLVPLNCFVINEQFVFFDQEFCIERFPANILVYRLLAIIYAGDKTKNRILPMEFFINRYGLGEKWSVYEQLAHEYITQLRNQDKMENWNKQHCTNSGLIMTNRERINNEYKKAYIETCFDCLDQRDIYVFGSGRIADRFMEMYQHDYKICLVLDNDSCKTGQFFHGIRIDSPGRLQGLDPNTYKVIVCVKECREILEQLKQLGCTQIGVFDNHYVYPGRQRFGSAYLNTKGLLNFGKKKYHIGYISGVFDLYHIGHINMLRRAKELCDYLIAAVTSDEYVRNHKGKEPFIPFEERCEVLKSCMYVDEVVGVPYKYAGTVEAFQKYHFDVQFCGSDYENDPWWLAQKRYLEEHGATLVFFPYTEQTSSTKIKALIDQNLL